MDLLAFMKLVTELTTFAPSLATVAICPADGLDGSALTALFKVLTDDVIALVSVGKSLLAELTSVVASFSIFCNCAWTALMPLLKLRLVRPLTEFSRLVRSVQ